MEIHWKWDYMISLVIWYMLYLWGVVDRSSLRHRRFTFKKLVLIYDDLGNWKFSRREFVSRTKSLRAPDYICINQFFFAKYLWNPVHECFWAYFNLFLLCNRRMRNGAAALHFISNASRLFSNAFCDFLLQRNGEIPNIFISKLNFLPVIKNICIFFTVFTPQSIKLAKVELYSTLHTDVTSNNNWKWLPLIFVTGYIPLQNCKFPENLPDD